MAKPRSLNGHTFIEGKPKKTHQGSGRHSLPKKGKKRYRGQGRCMDQTTLNNWRRIKEALEREGKTDSYFYKRAIAILAGRPDPL